MLIDHPTNPHLWCHDPPMSEPCYVCGEKTRWVELDIGFKHENCDLYPSEAGHVRIVRGVKTKTIEPYAD